MSRRRVALCPSFLRPLRAAPLLLLLLLLLLLSGPLAAATPGLPTGSSTGAAGEGYGLLERLMSDSAGQRRAAARRLIESGDVSLVPGLVDAYFFLPRNARAEALSVLIALTGERAGDRYHDWVELVGRRPDLAARPGYLAWKAALLARIDPRYPSLLYAGAPVRIRVEEVVWGGVPIEGIPDLDRPAHVPAARADYLTSSERVYGVSLGGETRAYPLRIVDWHEVVNDVVGGEPVTLAYSSLCGSGILYSTRAVPGEAYTFGTSGLLYRANKLMVDRQTRSLWSHLTGEPVIGRLADSPTPDHRLAVLPLTLTTWQEWRGRHPETTVLALDSEMERRFGFHYVPGAAERKRAGVNFPTGPQSGALAAKTEVYAVRLGSRAKAYPVARALAERVIDDRLGDEPVVVVADPESGAVRAYRRGERNFTRGPRAGELVDGEGRRWTVGEDALLPQEAGPTVAPLPRLPGHQSFWSGWYAFFPGASLYGSPARVVP